MKEERRCILVETALLGQGLPSVHPEEIAYFWPYDDCIRLAWMEAGECITGTIADFFKASNRICDWKRVDARKFDLAIQEKHNAFLTISATLKLANKLNSQVLVTAGMGGIFEDRSSADLEEIPKHRVLLISSGFKDVCNASQSLAYLQKCGIWAARTEPGLMNGFLFPGQDYTLDELYHHQSLDNLPLHQGGVLFHAIPAGLKLQQPEYLKKALATARKAGTEQFHPMVNKELDQLTNGYSSYLQLRALISNLHLARQILSYS